MGKAQSLNQQKLSEICSKETPLAFLVDMKIGLYMIHCLATAILNEMYIVEIQLTLVISKLKGPTKTLRDIRTSTCQICSIEEKTIRTTRFHK